LEKIEKFIVGFGILAFFVAIFFLVPALLWWNATISTVTKADPEIVNGILTVSSLIFAFQFAFFRYKGKVRMGWVGILITQLLLIAGVGFKYVSDTISYGYLTTNTLLSAYLTFAYILLMTMVLALIDLLVLWTGITA